MPLTLFHVGPGLVVKALGSTYFSLTVFCLVQVVMDSEVVYALLTGGYPLHGVMHTYLGATVVGVLSAAIGRPLCVRLKRAWNARMSPDLRQNLSLQDQITVPAALIGAFVGSYSHVFLDSLMHPDMTPLAPLALSNSMLNRMTVVQLHVLCVLLGGVGVLALLYRKARHTASHSQ